ncbi:MAG: cytochrome c biogenesis protein CcsA [Fimbriimonadaceae bacterium]|nr:cytochrome c biogenesis protein CcsA [Fimbriimonadaceae bacterium]QYK55061.1 MAG: cytochrome c biogenesis protein CcsA [Fimbriimonadaceae bacterium]
MTATLFAASFLLAVFAPARWREKAASWAFVAGCAGIFGVFAALATLFVNDRFEFSYVWAHAEHGNALQYRIAGIWSGQEGSFLLWGVCAAVFGLLVLPKAGVYKRWYVAVTSLFLGSIASILAYESPFKLNMLEGRPLVPLNGVGLAPTLQNYWVVIHPPTIFLGFGSLTALFALATAALIIRDYDKWVPIVRPWAIVSTTLVGLGLCMGGFWAYETLGWGGFWMWDPVENVSFVPWVLTAGFIHGLIVQASRGKWKLTNLALGGLPFLAFLYGTFLTRSGFLADASVHSFAEMDRSALKLLIGLMSVMTLGFLGLWGVRYFQDKRNAPEDEVKGFNREGFYRTGVLLLSAMGVATMIGMSVPLFMALSGRKPAVVEEHTYHMVLPYIFVPLMLVMAVAPFAAWKGMKARELASRAYTAFCVTIGLLGFALIGLKFTPMAGIADLTKSVTFPMNMQVPGLPWVLILVGTCLFVLVANGVRMVELARASKLGMGSFVSHIGVAVLLAGLILSRGFERHEQGVVMEGHPARILDYVLMLDGRTSDLTDKENKVLIKVFDAKGKDATKPLFVAKPGLYYTQMGGGELTPVQWPSIQRYAAHDVYVTLYPPQPQTSREFSLKKGGELTIDNKRKIKYLGMTREGEAGVTGTKFGARIELTDGENVTELQPQMELGEGGPINHPVGVGQDLRLKMTGMDAADGSVRIVFEQDAMIYPVEVFNKPFTGLVWLGTGTMTLGGILAALYRRQRVPKTAAQPVRTETSPASRELITTRT